MIRTKIHRIHEFLITETALKVMILFILSMQSPKCQVEADSLYQEGTALENLGEYESAIRVFGKLLDHLTTPNTDQDTIMVKRTIAAFYHVAYNHYRLRQFDQSLSLVRQGINYAKQHRTTIDHSLANLRRIQGAIYYLQRQLDSAQYHLEEGLRIFTDLEENDHLDVALLLNNLSIVYRAKGEEKLALQSDREQLRILERIYPDSQSRRICRCLGNIGASFGYLNQFDSLMHFASRAAACYLEIGDTLHHFSALNNMGYSLLQNGYLERAEDVFEKIKDFDKSPQDSALLALAYFNLGDVYHQQRDFHLSAEYHREALRIRKLIATNARDIATSYHNVGRALFQLEDTTCLNFLLEALQIRKKELPAEHPDHNLSKNALLNYYIFLKPDSLLVREYGEKTILGYQKMGNDVGLENTYASLASYHQKRGDLITALAYRRRAIIHSVNVYGPNHVNTGRRYRQLAEVLISLTEYDSAKNYLDLAVEISAPFWKSEEDIDSQLITDPFGLSESFLLLAELVKRQLNGTSEPKLLQQILSYYDRSIRLIGMVRDGYNFSEARLDLIAASKNIFAAAIEISIQLHRESKEESYLEKIFKYISGAKSIELNEKMQTKWLKSMEILPDALVHAMEEHLFYIDYYKARLNQLQHQDEVKATEQEINHELLVHRNKYDSLDLIANKIYPRYTALKKSEPLSLQNLKTILEESQSTLVEYFWSDDLMVILYVNGNEVRLHSDTVTDSLSNLIASYIDLTQMRPSSRQEDSAALRELKFFGAISNTLYQKLLAPVLYGTVGYGNLYIVADDLLNKFPFESLITSLDKVVYDYRHLPYLGTQYNIARLFSSAFLTMKTIKLQVDSYLGFAPKYVEMNNITQDIQDTFANDQADKGELRFAEREILEVAEIMDGQAILGKEASKQAFINKAPRARIIHFAGHAQTNEYSPMHSEISFGDGDPLFAYEFGHFTLQAELAVLSACGSGSGKISKGEGLFGLSRSLTLAGCKSLVVSLWKANDRSTYQIMKGFFSNLVVGKSKSASLTQAKKMYLDHVEDPLKGHPFYWSHLILYGDHQSLKGVSATQRTMVIGIIMISGLVASMIYFMMRK